MSKGSNRRPSVVDDAELEERWARIFATSDRELIARYGSIQDPQPAPDPAGQPEETQQ